MIVSVIVTQHHRRPSTQISRKPVLLVCCSWFGVVLVGFVGFVGGFGWFCWWFWVLLGGFGWFRVLVSSTHEYDDHIKLSAFTPPYKYTMDAFLIILK